MDAQHLQVADGLIGKAKEALIIEEYAKCEKLCASAIEHNPDHPHAYYLLSEVLRSVNELDDAIKLVERAIVLDEVNPLYHYQKGLISFKRGNKSLAIESLNEAISYDNSYIDAIALLGKLYLENNEHKPAKKYFEDILRIDPRNGMGHYYLHVAKKAVGG